MIEYFLVVQTTPETCQIYLDLSEVKVKKKKALFFFKLFQNSLTSKNIQRMVFLEVNKNPLRTLHLLFGQILIPIMQNQKNQQGWNELLTKNLLEKVNEFIA